MFLHLAKSQRLASQESWVQLSNFTICDLLLPDLMFFPFCLFRPNTIQLKKTIFRLKGLFGSAYNCGVA